MKLENLLLFSERPVYALWNRMHIQLIKACRTLVLIKWKRERGVIDNTL